MKTKNDKTVSATMTQYEIDRFGCEPNKIPFDTDVKTSCQKQYECEYNLIQECEVEPDYTDFNKNYMYTHSRNSVYLQYYGDDKFPFNLDYGVEE